MSNKFPNTLIIRQFILFLLPLSLGLGMIVAIFYKMGEVADRRLGQLTEAHQVEIKSEMGIIRVNFNYEQSTIVQQQILQNQSSIEKQLTPLLDRILIIGFCLLSLGAGIFYLIFISQVGQRKAEKALQYSESRYQKLTANIPGIIYEFTIRSDGWSGFTYASKNCPDLVGLEIKDSIDRSKFFMESIHPKDRLSLQDAIAKSAQTLENFTWEGEIINPDHKKSIRATSHPEKQPNGDIIWAGILIDITDLKAKELNLQELKEQLEHRVAEKDQALQVSEAKFKRKVEDLELALKQVQKTQSQLVQYQKISTLGQLVASVAHEITNPVNFIYGNLVHAAKYSEEMISLLNLYQKYSYHPVKKIQELEEEIEINFIKEDLPKVLSSMKVGADRIHQILLSLRSAYQMSELDRKEVDIHEEINSTIEILQSRLNAKSDRPKISIIKNYGKLPTVECYAGQINQVFLHILSNAIEALDEAHAYGLENLCINLTTKLLDYHQIEIRIADNGNGIAESAKPNLFDPFFSTKELGAGAGLGLAISHQIIINKHHGDLSFVSEMGQGTEFIIKIPLRQSFASDHISA